MSFLKTYGLPLLVFFTGACVLVVEVVAVRILSPFFGNTTFTVSSVLGIVLAALSIGYYYGGRLADKRPEYDVFFGLVFLSGIGVLVIYILMVTVMPVIAYKLPVMAGPLVVSVLLFFIPATILGTLSPFAVKLQGMLAPEMGTGSVAGLIFFWSTLGSIAGSLLAGFVFIPFFGVNAIMIAVGVALTAVGMSLLVASGGHKKKIFKTFRAGSVGVLIVSASVIYSGEPADVLYSDDGIYEKITIYDGYYREKPVRFLMQDRTVSGGIHLESDELAFDYAKYYVLYKAFNPDIKTALSIGGGPYTIPKVLLADLPQVQIDASEIEPSLFELSKKYFGLPDDPRLKNFIGDGRRMLHEADKQYDFIFSDVYRSLYSIPSHFTTTEFFQLAKKRLNKNGVFMANLIGSLSRQEPSFLLSEMKTFRDIFPNSYLFAVDSPASSHVQNFIAVGYNSDRKVDFSAEISADKGGVISALSAHMVDFERFDLSFHQKLTDNYSPVEYMTSSTLKRDLAPKRFLEGEEMMGLLTQLLRQGPARTHGFLLVEMHALSEDVTEQASAVTAHFSPEKKERVVLGASYASVSGVAILIEIARMLSTEKPDLPVGVDIVFSGGKVSGPDPFYEGKKVVGSMMLDKACDAGVCNAKSMEAAGHAVMQYLSGMKRDNNL